MAVRIYETGNPPRLITSKPGYNASPSLRDDLKTFDSNWFNGGGVKFKFGGQVPANFVFNFPYSLNFIPKYLITGGVTWNNDSLRFYYNHPNSPGYSVNPPSNALILGWQSDNSAVRAYTNRIELNNPGAAPSGAYLSILVFEA